MLKILGIGNTLLDIVLSTSHFPKEDEEIRATRRDFQVGGNISNTLYVLKQLGHSTDLVSTIAGDHASKQILSGLKDHGIGTQHLQRYIQGQTPTSYITLNNETGSRTITHFRNLPEVDFDFFAKIEVENYDWLHFEGRNIENLIGMINIAKTFLTHQPISLEVEKDRQGIDSAIPLANLIIFSHHFAKQRGFKDGERLLTEMKKLAPNANLLCTWGKQGAWFSAPQSNIQHQPIHPIPQILDTLGAGDTFNAALIHAISEKKDLKSAVQFASQLAGRKCQQRGLDNLLTEIKDKKPIANIEQLSTSKTLIVPCADLDNSVILIKHNNTVKAYQNNCPHQDVPLIEDYKIDVNPFDKTMKCSVHEAFFTIEDGTCTEGPCINEKLVSVSINLKENGDIYLA